MKEPKKFTIHRNDAGSEAYRDQYVLSLEDEVARLQRVETDLSRIAQKRYLEIARLQLNTKRLRYLIDDIADLHERQKRNELLSRMKIMSRIATFGAIDAALARLAANSGVGQT